MKAVFRAIWSFIRRTDKLLLLMCMAASGLSVTLLYSIAVNGIVSNFGLYKSQLAYSLLGAACAIILSMIDYKVLAKLWFLHAPFALLLSVLTFTGMGVTRGDNRAWLNFFGLVQFQPSEFMKISFILLFAYHLGKAGENLNKLPQFLLLCVDAALFAGLVALQGDTGTALVFVFIAVCMLFVAGLSWKYIIAALAAVPAVSPLLWLYVLKPYQKDRILSIFSSDPTLVDTQYQQTQGKIALGSGQFSGKGIFGGVYSYVAEIYNDFIFAYIGQTLGFVGCVATVVLLAFICLKILSTSWSTSEPMGKYICTGVFAMIVFHSVTNIGMVLGVLPVIGLPLPFISQGGTSALTMYLAVGLTMSVYARRPKPYTLFYES